LPVNSPRALWATNHPEKNHFTARINISQIIFNCILYFDYTAEEKITQTDNGLTKA